MRRYGPLHFILYYLMIAFAFVSCDHRTTPIERIRPAPQFTVDLNVVKDLSQGKNIADITFGRNGVPFADAVIKINDLVIPSTGNGHYLTDTPGFILPAGPVNVSFSSVDDSYLKTFSMVIPDTFRIKSVNPRLLDNGLVNVQLQWSSAPGATHYIVSVVGKNYTIDNSVPDSVLLGPQDTLYTIPYTTFQDPHSFFKIPDTYYIYVIAFNEGFGAYAEMPIIVFPSVIPQRTVSDPAGHFKYGTVAPIDSIIVPL